MSLAGRVKALLERHDLRAKRSFGQNFLIDQSTLDRIADAAVEGASTVIEIGPGPGTLTAALLERGVSVVAVEKDRDMVRMLQEEMPHPRLTVMEADVLSIRYEALAPGANVAGNIPYNVSAPILFGLLGQRRHIGAATVMLQKEVADRILSRPGTKAYGSISVMLQAFADIERIAKVSRGSFMPPPKVDSSVIRLRWRDGPADLANEARFERVVRAAFAQRRKKLRNSLRTAFPPAVVDAAGTKSGLSLDRRAESLSVAEFAALAAAFPET